MDARSASVVASAAPAEAMDSVTLLSLGYVLDSIEISRDGGDIVDRLLVAAILDANLARVRQDMALQTTYARLDAPPPDALSRPVSINAVAQSLGLPFETVRRRLARLARRGLCTVTTRGVLVPLAALATPRFEAMGLARYRRLERFHRDLTAAGALPDLPAPAEALAAAGGPPVRIANRILAEYLMRSIESVMRRIGDPLTGLLLLHVLGANTEHLEPAAEGPPAEGGCRPVRINRLAQRLNVPAETARRHVLLLMRAGYCRRTPEGVVARLDGLSGPAISALLDENRANVRRMFSHLARYGVLEDWKVATPPCTP